VCARSLEGLAMLAVSAAPERAVRYAAAADSMRGRLGASGQLVERARVESAMQTALEALGAAAFAAAWNQGAAARAAELLADMLLGHGG
jgi:hypothetical protein